MTVEHVNGERVSYDPRRLQGVVLYREAERALAEGDRVQFTAPLREQHIANRDLGTVEKIEANGDMKIRLDSDREVRLNIRDPQHVDYGYAVTSHSSQGQTADRVLIHVDTEQAHPNLINSRMAYVSVSRARYDAQIYTNDKTNHGEELSRDVSHRSAIQQGRAAEPQPGQNLVSSQAAIHAHETVIAHGHGIGR